MILTHGKTVSCKCCVPKIESEDENQQQTSTENEIQISPADTVPKETEILAASICE